MPVAFWMASPGDTVQACPQRRQQWEYNCAMSTLYNAAYVDRRKKKVLGSKACRRKPLI